MPYQEVPPKIKKGDQNLSQRQKSTSTVANFMSRTLSKTELIIIHNTVNTRISRISVGGGVIRGGGEGGPYSEVGSDQAQTVAYIHVY